MERLAHRRRSTGAQRSTKPIEASGAEVPPAPTGSDSSATPETTSPQFVHTVSWDSGCASSAVEPQEGQRRAAMLAILRVAEAERTSSSRTSRFQNLAHDEEFSWIPGHKRR